jgi:uncharacterized protein
MSENSSNDFREKVSRQMARVNAILHHPDYQQWIMEINEAETGREFCRHGLEHAFDVARIAYEIWLDSGGKPVAKDIIYAAALLHDVGRYLSYDNENVDHAAASASLAEDLLTEIGYHPEVVKAITDAIRQHRKPGADGLARVLYEADKISRPCYFCPAAGKCNWVVKNQYLLY